MDVGEVLGLVADDEVPWLEGGPGMGPPRQDVDRAPGEIDLVPEAAIAQSGLVPFRRGVYPRPVSANRGACFLPRAWYSVKERRGFP